MAYDLTWYDSGWLARYIAAKEIIARVAPSRLQEFVDSFSALRTDPAFEVCDLPGVLDPATLELVRSTVKSIPMSDMEMHEVKRFGRFVIHDHPVFLDIQRNLTSKVSGLVGQEVEPSYNFLSLYTRMGVCEPHLDAPSAKWTLDICIDQSEPWPIHFSQIVPWPEERIAVDGNWQQRMKSAPGLAFQSKILHPGNGIIFSGSSQWHYRDALPRGNSRAFCNLLFFHFIPKGTSELVKPGNWPRLFGVPELSSIPDMAEDW